jgi:hypothetical protein
MMRKTVHTPATIIKVFFVNTVEDSRFSSMLHSGELPEKLMRTWQSLGESFSCHSCQFLTAAMLRHWYAYTSKRLVESLTNFQSSETDGQLAAIRA